MAKSGLAEALFWHKERNGVRCELCSWRCFIPRDKLGFCQVRKNVDNSLYSLNYGKVVSTGMTNMENVPLFHFYPASKTFFVHTTGSSFRMDFRDTGDRARDIGVNRMLGEIDKSKANSVTFGGGDPIVDMEYVLEIMKANKKEGVANVIATNGYLTNDVNKKVNKFIDAVSVEIYASLEKDFYKSHCAVDDIEPIMAFMKHIKKHRVHMEITNLIIPQVGDSMEAFKKFADFITSDIDSYMPLHLVQFKPSGALAHMPKASNAVLEKFWEEAKRTGMRNVFAQGLLGREDTMCYNCSQLLIKRENRTVKKVDLKNGRCPSCGLKMNIVNK